MRLLLLGRQRVQDRDKEQKHKTEIRNRLTKRRYKIEMD